MDIQADITFQITKQVEQLPDALQRKVLEFARTLLPAKGVDRSTLLRFAGSIPPSDCDAMSSAIKDGCETVDPNGW